MTTAAVPSTIQAMDSFRFSSWGIKNAQMNISFPLNESLTEEMKEMWIYDLRVIQKQITDEFVSQLLTYRTPFTIVLIVLYMLSFIVGLIGNSMVIMVMVDVLDWHERR